MTWGVWSSSPDIRSKLADEIVEILLAAKFALRLLDQKVPLLFSWPLILNQEAAICGELVPILWIEKVLWVLLPILIHKRRRICDYVVNVWTFAVDPTLNRPLNLLLEFLQTLLVFQRVVSFETYRSIDVPVTKIDNPTHVLRRWHVSSPPRLSSLVHNVIIHACAPISLVFVFARSFLLSSWLTAAHLLLLLALFCLLLLDFLFLFFRRNIDLF